MKVEMNHINEQLRHTKTSYWIEALYALAVVAVLMTVMFFWVDEPLRAFLKGIVFFLATSTYFVFKTTYDSRIMTYKEHLNAQYAVIPLAMLLIY